MAEEQGRKPETVSDDGQERLVDQIKTDSINMLRDDVLGAKEWNRSKFGWALGVTPFAKVARSSVRLITEPVSVTWNTGRRFFAKATATPLPTESVDPAERFEVAAEHYRRTPSDIALDIDTTSKWFSIYFVISALLLGYGLVAMFHLGRTNMPKWGELITDFSILPAALGFLMQMGFQNWQLRHRKLGSFLAYASKPSEWMAEPAVRTGGGGGSGTSRLAIVLAVGASISFGAWMGIGPAQADMPTGGGGASPINAVSAVLSTPPDTDIWKSMLTYIFPNIGPLGTQAISGLDSNQRMPQAAAIQGAFATFLAVLMALSSVALSYFTLMGTISTAHEGQVMGQRWHTFYAPVRVVTGFGFLVPIVNGYCLAQVMVIYVAVWGGSFGNAIWAGYVDTLGSRQVAPQMQTVQLTVLKNILTLEGCRQALGTRTTNLADAFIGAAGAAATSSLTPTSDTNSFYAPRTLPTWQQVGNGFIVDARNTLPTWAGGTPSARQNWAMDFGTCGGVNITSVSSGDSSLMKFDTAVRDAVTAYLGAVSPFVTAQIASNNPARNAQPVSAPDVATLTTAITNFNTSIQGSQNDLRDALLAQNSNTSLSTLRQQMKSWGWASAGTFYMSISSLYENYSTNSNRMAQAVSGPSLPAYGASAVPGNPVPDIQNKLVTMFNKAAVSFASTSTTPDLAATAVALATLNNDNGSGSGSDNFNSILQAPMLKQAVGMLRVDLNKGSGLDHMVAFGHALLIAWGVVIAGILAVSSIFSYIGGALAAAGTGAAVGGLLGAGIGGLIGAGAAAATKSFVGTVMSQLGGLIQTLIVIILAIGIVHAYVLPMIPYIMMTFFLIGMLTLVVEGVVAAPLWAFFHIRPDGQEFVESVQKPGYMILFNLLLRIPLALFGMFFSYMLIDVLMWFESITFIPAFLAASSSDSYGLFGILTALGLVGFLHWQFCIRSFGMITHLPDNVTRWFGQAGERLNEHEGSHNVVGALVRNAESRVNVLSGGGMVGGVMNGIGGNGGNGESGSNAVDSVTSPKRPTSAPSAPRRPPSTGGLRR